MGKMSNSPGICAGAGEMLACNKRELKRVVADSDMTLHLSVYGETKEGV